MLCDNKRTIFSIAQAEKYAHITYFFNGEKEDVLSCEVRHLIPSTNVQHHSKSPEMSTTEITDTVIKSLLNDPKDFYLINYANTDMVGHSDDCNATIKIIKCIDTQLGRLYQILVHDMDGTLFIVGDHGNAEQNIDPITATLPFMHNHHGLVPFIVATQHPPHDLVSPMKGLADVAPAILQYMGIAVPPEMTGEPT